jgi:hypothetical protein
LFFHTKGAFRRLGWNGLIVIVCLSNIVNCAIGIARTRMKGHLNHRVLLFILIVVLPPVLSMFQSLGALKLLPRSISICSPLIAILLMVPSIARFSTKNTMIKWIVFALLFLPVLLITISSRLPFPVIRRLLDSSLGTKKIFRRQLIIRLCMFAALAMSVFMCDYYPMHWVVVVVYDLYALVVVSFGNLQFPAAVARIWIALMRLVKHDYYGKDANNSSKTNLGPSLNIFYGMVLGQGILYVMACLLQNFSFIPQKSLARRSGLTSQCGRNFISLYYSYALEKNMEGDVLAPKKISLNSFAINCLDSEKPEMQLHGIQVIHSLLLREETRKQLFTKLTSSTKVMARLIEMLGWSSPQDRNIRFFAAKVICELATSLRVVTIPGTIQVVSALLDYGNQQERANPLLNIEVEHEKIPHPIQNIDDNHEERLSVGQDTGNLLVETPENSTQQVCTSSEQQKPEKLRCWQQHIFGCWSIPQKEPKPLTEKDPLPALGMSILDGLVCCDQDNCVEISKTSSLVPKIVRFTGYGRSSDTMYTHSQRKVLMKTSLKLLHSLTCIHGEVGITLRHKVSKNPFLLRNLAAVLRDIMSSHELKRLVAGVLRNLAIDRDARQAIGRNQVIILRLVHAFLTPGGSSSTESGLLLFQRAAGQALAMLAMDNVNNPLAMLKEAEYEFIKELTIMIYVNRYRCVAASLLQSTCRHAVLGLKSRT